MNTFEKSVILLPGISAVVESERFDPFENKANAEGYTLHRFNAWENDDVLKEMTLEYIHRKLYELIESIQGKVHIIGKSFGGGITLISSHEDISYVVLLAPAIGLSGITQSDFSTISDFKTQVSNLQVLNTSSQELQQKNIPIHIIHGTNDTTIPLQNSKDIVQNLPKGSLHTLKGADHSFRNIEHEKAIIEDTFSFISSQ